MRQQMCAIAYVEDPESLVVEALRLLNSALKLIKYAKKSKKSKKTKKKTGKAKPKP